MIGKAVLGVLLAVAMSPALAWGDHGHRAIADIAWTELTPAAKRGVEQLLESTPTLATPECPVGSLEDAATWADCVRSRYKERYAGTATWHYVDVSVCQPFSLPADPEARFAVTRYTRELAVLADRRQSPVVRLEALLWVAHLVGDLHQPLHVGDAGDRGGNETRVWPQSGRYPLNLHAEWDKVLVDRAMEASPGDVAGLAYAAQRDSANWREGSPVVWAKESWAIARSVAYGTQSPNCQGTSATIDVGAAYQRAALSVVEGRLERAGVRLADALNRAF